MASTGLPPASYWGLFTASDFISILDDALGLSIIVSADGFFCNEFDSILSKMFMATQINLKCTLTQFLKEMMREIQA